MSHHERCDLMETVSFGSLGNKCTCDYEEGVDQGYALAKDTITRLEEKVKTLTSQITTLNRYK